MDKLKKRQLQFKNVEFRAITEEDGIKKIRGYPIVFGVAGSPYRGWEWTEVIDKNALADVDLTDLMFLGFHKQNEPIAKNGVNMRVEIDNTGLFIEATLGDTEYDKFIFDRVNRGIIEGMSFSFYADKWDVDQEKKQETIMHITDLIEVSLVTFPAYDLTIAMATERNTLQKEDDDESQKKLDRSKLLFELELASI